MANSNSSRDFPYCAVNSAIYVQCTNGDRDFVAAAPPAHIRTVLNLLNRAAREQDRRHYTASARLYAAAESVPGFAWVEVA